MLRKTTLTKTKYKDLFPSSLANRTPANEVTDKAAIVRREERGMQSMKSFLDTLMAHAMGLEQEWRPGCRCVRQEDAPLVQDDVIDNRPVRPRRPCCNLRALVDEGRQRCRFLAQLIIQLKRRQGQCAH
jgi:hypothetical protein